MVRRIADRLGQLGEARRLLGPLDQLHRLGHRLAVAADLVGLAPEARAIAGRARFLGRGEEGHILALGPLRRAARLAIDAGRIDRADDPAVPAAVAAHERRPGGVGIEARDIAHAVRSRRVIVGGKRGHGQFLSIFAEKQPRVALWAWMVAISGLANSWRMPGVGLARLGQDRLGHHPVASNPRSDSTRGSNTGGTSSTYSAGSWSAFGDEDRMARAIGIGDVVADVIDSKHALADRAVGQADAAREGRVGDGHPHASARRELVVRQAEERLDKARDPAL